MYHFCCRKDDKKRKENFPILCLPVFMAWLLKYLMQYK
ncbi:MAG: hypothetical protein AVDCRST_MAG96-3096 [uncultured Segetibacter sp.]|uniref:Uncharacterized protein n=1 Tax=uncultured Segetibacter sp. TaxID=481133 RepID=A0A6J4TIM1_9BACT|nr:MAG: hypothetical protein AVDCRST_MAG96-3096 [uncultured Segetibacter sp.]